MHWFCTLQEVLDPVNGYLSADGDCSIEVDADLFVTCIIPPAVDWIVAALHV
jgi:hypothetical protein